MSPQSNPVDAWVTRQNGIWFRSADYRGNVRMKDHRGGTGGAVDMASPITAPLERAAAPTLLLRICGLRG
jgi:hypothetical protein